jgi:hypothetical protein
MYKNLAFLSLPCFLLICIVSCTKPVIENKAPVSNAGSDMSYPLPIEYIPLSGSGYDEDGTVAGYIWSQVSGPSTATIANPGAPSTEVKNIIPGRYVFQLAVVDDKGAIGVDTVALLFTSATLITRTIDPINNPYEIKMMNYNGKDESGPYQPDIVLAAWTRDGLPFNNSAVLKFDLTGIPKSAKLSQARLMLYSYPDPLNGNKKDANFGTDNSFIVQLIGSGWDTSTIKTTFFPLISSSHKFIVPHTNEPFLDLNLDVTYLVANMISSGINHGIFMRLQNPVIYNSRIFVSSSNATYRAKRPKLVLQYDL